MHDALNEFKTYATTFDFVLQSGWGGLEWKLLLVSTKCNQSVSEWWWKVVLCFRVGDQRVKRSFWVGSEEGGSGGHLVARCRSSATVIGTSRRGMLGTVLSHSRSPAPTPYSHFHIRTPPFPATRTFVHEPEYACSLFWDRIPKLPLSYSWQLLSYS